MFRRILPIVILLVVAATAFFTLGEKKQALLGNRPSEFATLDTGTAKTLTPTSVEAQSGLSSAAPKPTKTKKTIHSRRYAALSKSGNAVISNPAADARAASLLASYANESQKQLAFSLLVGQVVGAIQGSRPFTEFYAEGSYQFTANQKFGISEEARKLYLVENQGEDEFLASDLLLFHEARLSPDFLTLNWKLITSATLPISAESRRLRHVTRPSVGIEFGRTFFGGTLAVSAQPSASYYLNNYATDPGGTPLRRFSLGQQVQAEVQLIPGTLSLIGWGKGFYHFFQQYDTRTDTPDPSTSYDYGGHVNLNLNKYIATQIGYLRGNSILSQAGYDLNFYDEPASRFFAALKISL